MIRLLLFNIFFDLSLIALPIAFVIRKEMSLKKALQFLGFKKIGLRELVEKTGFIFFALIAVSIWLSIALNFLALNDLELVSQTLEETASVIPLFFWIVILRVISEEIFFRGYLVKKLGVLGSSAIFALFHVGYGSTAEILGAFVLGLILAKTYQLNKNLYPSILAHMAYNAIAMAALWGI